MGSSVRMVVSRRRGRCTTGCFCRCFRRSVLLLYGSAGRDDAYITYWVATRWVCAAAWRMIVARDRRAPSLSACSYSQRSLGSRVSVPTLGAWVGVVAGACCAPVAYRLSSRLERRSSWVAAALVATSPPLVYWAFGGLETSLTSLVVLLAVLSLAWYSIGHTVRARLLVWLLAAVLVRPEVGLVLIGALVAAALVMHAGRHSPEVAGDAARVGAARRL